MGGIKLTWRKKCLSKKEYSRVANILKPGDLVFVGTRREISHFFLRGDLTHALIYIGKKKFIHAEGKYGVGGIYLRELFEKYDFLSAYRHPNFDLDSKNKLMAFLLESYGKAYDFRFLQKNKSEFYCTKLVELAYKKAGIIIKKKVDCNIPYISTPHPEDFVLDDFELVFMSEYLQEKRNKKRIGFWDLFVRSFRLG